MRFPDTQWSLIRACGGSPSARRVAFGELAGDYRAAIVAFFTARLDRQRAEDAAQSFLAASFEHAWWSRADAELGSFRGFLLLLLRRHLGHLRAGEGKAEFALDELPERHDEAADAQRRFDARFALILTARAVGALRVQYAQRERGELFARLLPLLSSPPAYGEGKDVAAALGLPANTLAVEIKRLRSRLREALRAELRELCVDEAAFEREWEGLRELLGG